MKDITENYHGGADTSVAAHYGTPEQHRQNCRVTILSLVRFAEARGYTCDELEVATSYSHQNASVRITELRADGLIADSGRRRNTRSGRGARVYVVPEFAESLNPSNSTGLKSKVESSKRAAESVEKEPMLF